MTLLISWIGVDGKKEGKSPASIYIASDSRYSWSNNVNPYDYGVKIFGSTKYPEIFGFCGDVIFPSILFGQIIPQLDADLLINEKDNGEDKNQKIFGYIKTSLESYPTQFLNGSFTILHCTRIKKEFKCYKTSFTPNIGLLNEEIVLPNVSTNIYIGGSGGKEFDTNWTLWDNEKHNNYRTSRAVYHCFTKTLRETKNPQVGGLPQIIGLYRKDNARIFGIIENNKKYIYGKESSDDIDFTKIEWRNGNFERMNPETLKIFDEAQRQPSE